MYPFRMSRAHFLYLLFSSSSFPLYRAFFSHTLLPVLSSHPHPTSAFPSFLSHFPALPLLTFLFLFSFPISLHPTPQYPSMMTIGKRSDSRETDLSGLHVVFFLRFTGVPCLATQPQVYT